MLTITRVDDADDDDCPDVAMHNKWLGNSVVFIWPVTILVWLRAKTPGMEAWSWKK
jgi:hypothetical protein